jgi:hypothetical protein
MYKFIKWYGILLAGIYACNSSNDIPKTGNSEFVSIRNGKFELNGESFYPIAINYLVSLQANGQAVWPSSSQSYFPGGRYQFTTMDSSIAELNAEMELIKEMGFNSVRIVGAGETSLDEKLNSLYIKASIGNERDTILLLSDSLAYKNYFTSLQYLFDAAENAGLKVIFLSPVFSTIPQTETHIQKLVSFFKNNSTIIAYYLFN